MTRWSTVSRPVNKLLAVLAVSLLAACGPAGDDSETPEAETEAGSWREDHRKLVIAMSLPAEVLGLGDRREILRDAIEARVEMPVEIRRVSGYDGVIQAMAANQVDLAAFGAGGYAGLHDLIGDTAQPILTTRGHAGDMGYYSSLMVKAESDFQSIEDLRSASIGYVDFNSTSGYIYPRYAMRQQGIDPDTYFGRSGMTGGHLQAVMALDGGQFDSVLALVGGGTPETGFSTGAAMIMAERGLIDLEDFRFVWYAGPIPNSAYVMRNDDRQEFIDLVRGVMAALPYEDATALEAYGWRRSTTLVGVSKAFYQPIIDMRAAEIAGETAAVPQDPSGDETGNEDQGTGDPEVDDPEADDPGVDEPEDGNQRGGR